MNAPLERPSSKDRLSAVIAAGLMLVIVFTALAHGAVEPWSILIFNSSVLLLMLLWVAKIVIDGRLKLMIPDIALPIGAILLIGLAQSIALTGDGGRWLSLSKDAGATRSTVITLLFLAAALLMTINFFADRRRLALLSNFLVMFGLAVAMFALIQFFTWNGSFYWIRPTESPTPFGPFANHNHFAGYMEMLIPLPIALMLTRAARGEMRLLYGFAAVIMGVAVLASLSRGGMISLAAGMVFIFAMSFRLKRDGRGGRRGQALRKRLPFLSFLFHPTTPVLAVGALIIAGIIWVGADPIIERIARDAAPSADQPAETFFSSRGWVWRDTLTMIRANPVLGAGLGAYRTAFPIYSESDGSLIVAQAHNDYLQIVADCGLVGGVMALCFIVILFRSVFRGIGSRDKAISGIALGSGAGLFAMLVHSLLDFNLQVPSNILLFLVLSAVATLTGMIAVEEEGTASLPQRHSPRVREIDRVKATAS
jgi:O-antigen ligase